MLIVIFLCLQCLIIISNPSFQCNGAQANIPPAAITTTQTQLKSNLHFLDNIIATQPKCNNNTAKTNANSDNPMKSTPFAMHIRLPFTDMFLQQERSVHLIEESEQQLFFVLHGNELFQLLINEHDKQLIFLGTLSGAAATHAEVLGATVISWHNYMLFALAYEEQIEIYQLSKVIIAQRVALVLDTKQAMNMMPPPPPPPLHFEPIQHLSMPGKYRRMHLIKPTAQKIMLFIVVNFTKHHHKYKTFEWLDAYFDPIDEVTLPAIHTLHVFGTKIKYILTGRAIRTQTKIILTVYEVAATTMKLEKRQTLTIDAHQIHAATFHGHNFIIACNAASCMNFRMSQAQFTLYKKRSSKELAFDKLTAGVALLVAARRNEVTIFNTARLDCFTAFTTNETQPHSLYTHINTHNETYVLLSYKRPFNTLLRIVQVDWEGDTTLGGAAAARSFVEQEEELQPLQQHRHEFEQTVGRLRSMLLQRKTAIDIFRQLTTYAKTPGVVQSKKRLTLPPTAKVQNIHINSEHVRSPMQLLARVRHLRETYLRRRITRSFGASLNNADMPSLKVQRLHVDNLIYDGNLLPGYHLDNLTKPMPILTIRLQLTTKLLQTRKLLTRENYKQSRQAYINSSTPATLTTNINELHVQRINNMSWAEFYESVYLRERDRDIQIVGRLIFQSEAHITNLTTTLLNNLVASQLFNLRVPQLVQSNIFMSGFFANKLDATHVNGLNFAEDIVFRGRESFIETPVKIQQISISGDILFANDSKLTPLARLATANTAADSDTIELQQFYTGKVILNGTLTLNNLLRENEKDSEIIVNGDVFSLATLKSDYLLRNTTQTFEQPIIFGYAKATMESFNTNYINEHPTKEHLLDNTENDFHKPLYVIFMNASINGNVICEDYSSKLRNLAENVVHHGEVANITGEKLFTAPLSINELMTLQLNDVPLNDLVLKSQLQDTTTLKFKDTKIFNNIVVNEKLDVTNDLNASLLNNLALDELLNYNYEMERLELPFRLKALNVAFHKINGISFDDVFNKLNIENEKLMLHKDLTIEGNVKFEAALNVQTINGIDWNEYEKNLVHFNEDAILTGRKRFLADVSITDALNSSTINGKAMNEVFEKTLLKNTAQVITGKYSFENLQLSNIDVSRINDMETSDFIDVRATKTVLKSQQLTVPKLLVKGNVIGNIDTNINFFNLTNNLRKLQAQQWRNLVVLGDVSWREPSAVDAQLTYLLENAVTRKGVQQISGNVKLRKPRIRHMKTNAQFPKFFDFQTLAKDALWKNSTEIQKISAPKTFLKNIQFNKLITTSMNLMTLNDIDIKRFNASLYRLSSGAPIVGPLKFIKPPVIGHLAVAGRVNGIKSAEIYQQTAAKTMPPITLERLIIDADLKINDINGMNLNYLLQNRIPLRGEALEIFGTLTFENLNLNKQIMLRSINNISLDNIVYRQYDKLQAIPANKHVQGRLYFEGPAHVLHLNGRHLTESYEQSIFTNRNYNIDSLIIDRATFNGGLEFFNNMLGRSEDNELKTITQPKQLIYLDYANDIAAQWLTARNVTPINSHINKKTISYHILKTSTSTCLRNVIELQTDAIKQSIYIKNSTTNILEKAAAPLAVKVDNYCKSESNKMRSQLKLACRNTSITMLTQGYIENIEFMSINNDKKIHFILLHIIMPKNKRNQIQIYRVDSENCNTILWQKIKKGVGSVMRLLRLQHDYHLVTNGLERQHPAIFIYDFNNTDEKFVLLQTIPGDYDIIEFLNVTTTQYNLLLSCNHCQRISIYAFNITDNNNNIKTSENTTYAIQQILKLSIPIAQIFIFELRNTAALERYMLVLPQTGESYYHLFKYAHIQGWLHRTYGYFDQILLAVPLIDQNGFDLIGLNNNADLLLLLCNHIKCGVVKAVLE